MVQRGGGVVAVKCMKTNGTTLLPIIDKFVTEGSTVYTDEHNSYNRLDTNKYIHKVVNHGRNEYVKGADFTNTIEGFWGIYIRKMIDGIYHSLSTKYLQRYIDETVWRYNTRKMNGATVSAICSVPQSVPWTTEWSSKWHKYTISKNIGVNR